jgi:hypothetical protein
LDRTGTCLFWERNSGKKLYRVVTSSAGSFDTTARRGGGHAGAAGEEVTPAGEVTKAAAVVAHVNGVCRLLPVWSFETEVGEGRSVLRTYVYTCFGISAGMHRR